MAERRPVNPLDFSRTADADLHAMVGRERYSQLAKLWAWHARRELERRGLPPTAG